jgi:hypothetical protein
LLLETKRACGTCHGEGVIPAEIGPTTCPDCGGTDTLPTRDVLIDWRIAEIERVHAKASDEVSPHVRWLAFELRRSRQALVQVFALSQELEEQNPIAQRIRFVANDALGLYEPLAPDSSEPHAK